MSRLILIALLVAVVIAVAALVISALSPQPAGQTAVGRPRSTGLQKVAYGLLLAVMFGVASGALGEG